MFLQASWYHFQRVNDADFIIVIIIIIIGFPHNSPQFYKVHENRLQTFRVTQKNKRTHERILAKMHFWLMPNTKLHELC